MNKELIQSRFSKNLESYDKNARIQKRMAENLLRHIKNKSVKRILEIGCGTGFLTNIISKNCSFESYTAIDIVAECNNYIKNFNPNIEFFCQDVEDFIINNNEKFDLIVSNASLQWVEDFEKTVRELKNKLNPNGELVFTTFGVENFKEIYHICGASLKYYSNNELINMFSDFNIKIEQEIHLLAFDSPKDVLKHLQQTGVNAIESKLWTKKDLIKFENAYKNLCSTRPTLTYNPIYVQIK